MARTFAGLFIFGCVVCFSAVLGGHLLHRRWDRKGFYE